MAEEDGRESLLRNDRDTDIALRSSSLDYWSNSDEDLAERPNSSRTRRRTNTRSDSKGEYIALEDRGRTTQRQKGLTRFSYCSKRCCIISAIVIGALFLVAGGGGFWVFKKKPSDGHSPPWYPTPLGGTLSKWKESYEHAHAMVEKMSLLEKVNVTTGVGVSVVDVYMQSDVLMRT